MNALIRSHSAMILVVLSATVASTALGASHSISWANPKPQGNPLQSIQFEDDAVGYTVGMRGTCLVTTDGGVTWTDRTDFESFRKHLMDILLMQPGEMIAVGENPGIFRSIDGGASWTPIQNPSTATLNEIARIDATTLSAVGDAGEVLRSTDDGATWELRAQPRGAFDLHDQCWTSPSHGYVVGEFVLRETSDGGASWAPIPGTTENNLFFPGDIQFLDSLNGWILVDLTTYRTTDGGTSWFERHGQIGSSPIYQEEAVILDASNRFVITDGEGAALWRTTDDGLHWTELYARQATRGLTGIVRLGDGALVAVSSDGDMLRSADEGLSWANATSAPGDGERQSIEAIDFAPNGIGFAGGNRELLRSSDGGASWQFAPAEPEISIIFAIDMFDESFGLAGGSISGGLSEIARTTDGGSSWNNHTIDSPPVGFVVDLKVVDASACYAALHGGTGVNFVYKSTDGGLGWNRMSSGLPSGARLHAIDFLDAQVGFAAGGDFGAPALYRTTDGGQSWSAVPLAGVQEAIRDMRWIDASTGFIASFDGVHRTTNGGQTWIQALSAYTTSISFVDGAVGYANDLFDPRVWRTEDGGATWEPIEMPCVNGSLTLLAREGGFIAAGAASVILRGETIDPAAVGAPREPEPLASGLRGSLGPGVRARLIGSVIEIDASRSAETWMVPTGRVLDIAGRSVADLSRSQPGRSVWRFSWDSRLATGERAPSGVYFLLVERGARRLVAKRLLLR